MRIKDVLARKGDAVVTVGREAPLTELLDLLTKHRIGAVVVIDPSGAVTGIVSERDVVRRLQRSPHDSAGARVHELMTPEPITCTPDDETETLAQTMTEHRIRHLPVIDDGRLVGIVSIGDVVKQRLDHLQHERDQLVNYVHHGG